MIKQNETTYRSFTIIENILLLEEKESYLSYYKARSRYFSTLEAAQENIDDWWAR